MQKHSGFALRQPVCAAAMFLTVTSLAQPSAGQSPRVRVEGGAIEGATADGFERFKGIPYATPPVGELRWRAPQPVKPWSGVRQTQNFGHDCMQKAKYVFGQITTEPSEDCLYLNVWRPASTSNSNLPVLVWFYGGGFAAGGSSALSYQGEAFARQGIIFVSANYRVGRFGFFAHPALAQERMNEPKGNFGLLDQVAALKWVRANVAAFGGNPDNVTIAGVSAGGMSVQAMILSPLARGLFQKAIVESGGLRGLSSRSIDQDRTGLPALETMGVAFARSRGITGTGSVAASQLRKLPAEILADLQQGLMPGATGGLGSWGGPAMDGKVLPRLDDVRSAGKHLARVAVLVGANSDEASLSNPTTAPSVDDILSRFKGQQAQARLAYDPSGRGEAVTILRQVTSDAIMGEPARYFARTMAAGGNPVYRYSFNYVPEGLQSQWQYGAPHGSETAFAFDTLSWLYGPAVSEKDSRVAKMANAYWVNFIKNGDPNGANLPRWPLYDVSKEAVMQFEADGAAHAQSDPLHDRLDLASTMTISNK